MLGLQGRSLAIIKTALLRQLSPKGKTDSVSPTTPNLFLIVIVEPVELSGGPVVRHPDSGYKLVVPEAVLL